MTTATRSRATDQPAATSRASEGTGPLTPTEQFALAYYGPCGGFWREGGGYAEGETLGEDLEPFIPWWVKAGLPCSCE